MSGLIGNPEDRFSNDADHFISGSTMRKTVSAPFFGGQGTSDSTERTPLLSGGGREMNHVADGSLVVDNDDLPVSFIESC